MGVSGPAEDLRPVSEVEAGVNFRPAGGVQGQVAGSIPRRQPGTGTRRVREGAVTPSLHPEVLGIQFVSPGYGLDIRQSMGWTKVCGTTKSGIWVLKGNARARKLPDNLDRLRVEWRKQGTYKTAWVTPGHGCLCPYKYGHGAAVRPQTNKAIWHGVIGLWGRVAPLLSPWCARREVPTGVNTSVHDSAFNSGGCCGLLPVCKSTSYNLEVCSQSPTGRKRVKGGVSGLAEDLRFVFRGGGRGQFSASWLCAGAGCRSLTRKAARHRYQEVG